MRDFLSIRFDMESADHDSTEAALLEAAIDSGLSRINYIRSGSSTDGTIVKLVYRRMSKLEEYDDCRRVK